MPGTVLEGEDVAVGKSKSLPPGVCLCVCVCVCKKTFINLIISQVNIQLPMGADSQREGNGDYHV